VSLSRKDGIDISTGIAEHQYGEAANRYTIASDVVRALVLAFRDDEESYGRDVVADAVSDIMMHGLAVLRERAGISRDGLGRTDGHRRDGIRHMLAAVDAAIRFLAPMYRTLDEQGGAS
jgi:hypothetical protein